MVKRSLLIGSYLVLTLTACGGTGGDGETDTAAQTPGGSDASTPVDEATGGPAGAEARPPAPFDVTMPDDQPGAVAPTEAGDAGPQDARPVGDGDATDIAALVGLWDYSRDRDDGFDRVLFSIAADGTITEFDDQADEAGSGAACHQIRTALLAARGNDRYDLQNTSTLPGSDSIDDVLITVARDTITFRYIGAAFDPEFGEGMSGITESYPRATGVTVDQLVPC